MNVHRERGCRLLDVKKYDVAATEFRAALAQEPNDSTTHALLACCLLNLDRDEEAEQEAETAVGCDADDPYAFYTLSRAKAALNKYCEAFTAIEACLRLAPLDADYLYLRAALLHDVGRFDDALPAADEALRQDPNHVAAANLRILALQAVGRADEADFEIDRVLKLNPEFAWSHENKGRIALRNGRVAESLVHYREALRLNPHKEMARRGFLEALKSRSVMYRIAAWLFPRSGNHVSTAWLIRAFLVSLVVGSIGGLAYGRMSPDWEYAKTPGASMVAGVMICLFLYLFLLMAMNRFGDAVFVFMLRFDRVGRTVLTRDERSRAEITTLCLFTSIGSMVGAVVWEIAWLWLVSAVVLLVILLAALVYRLPHLRDSWHKTFLGLATVMSILFLMIGLIAAFPKMPGIGVLAGMAWVAILRFFKRRRDAKRTAR